jgi:hypothetical protein
LSFNYCGGAVKTSVALVPPKPKEFDSAARLPLLGLVRHEIEL